MEQKDICIIGLGRFGVSVLDRLTEMGKNVIVVEEDQEKINKYGARASLAARMDSTEESALIELGVDRMDTVIIAIGEDIEASVITASTLKDIGVKNIIAKATSERHQQILEKIGVNSIIRPEIDAGIRAAEKAVYGHFLETTKVDYRNSMVRIKVMDEKVCEKPLNDLKIRNKTGFTIISITRSGEVIMPSPTDVFKLKDDVVAVGPNKNKYDFEKIFGVLTG